MHPYIIAPITTLVLSVGLGAYVFLKDTTDRFRRSFAMVTFWTFFASLGDIGMMATTDPDIALRFSHITWIGMVFVQPAILDLVLTISVWAAKWEHPIRQLGIYIPSFVLLLADTMGDIVKGVHLQTWGYEVVYGPFLMVWALLWLFYIGSGVLVLAFDLRNKKDGQRPIYSTLLIGILIPTVIDTFAEVYSRYLGIPNIITTQLALILFLIFFELAIYRRRIFVPMPKKESQKDKTAGSKLVLPPGHIYRIEGEPPKVTYDLFKRLVTSDLYGLVISRNSPQSVKSDTGLLETPMVWLSSTPKEGIRTLPPSEIGQVVHTVKEFIKKAEGTVVLLDGLEFLIFQNGAKITLSALFLLSETISVSNSRVLIPIEPKAIDPPTMALIQKETVDLRTVKGFERTSNEDKEQPA